MSLSPRRRSATIGCVALAVMLTGACVKPKAPGVGISPLNADIVFGVAKPEEAAPAGFVPSSAEASADTSSTDDLLPPEIITPVPQKNFPRPAFEASGPVKTDCPDAAVDAFPAETAPQTVPDHDHLPTAGIYKWKKSGSVTYAGANNATQLSGLEERIVRDVVEDAPLPNQAATRFRYSFQVVRPDVSSDRFLIETYHVDTALTSADTNPGSDIRVTAGAPERGLVLRSIEPIDKSGNKLPGAFHAQQGLLLAPLAIRTGEKFTSVAVDPTTQQTIQFEATTVNRQRVDACGEILEGWLIEGKRTISTASAQGTQDYSIIVAPQFGMQLLSEHINGLGVSADYSVGQRVPAPLPADEQ